MAKRYWNGAKTFGLFVVLLSIPLALGYLIEGGTYLWAFAAFGVLATAVTFWNSDKLALRAMHARPVTEVEQPAMYRIVSELSREANKPMPRLYISPTSAPNAFATGRGPRNAAVCCTDGILDILTERELRGVLGHELQHVYNRDMLIGSVAGAVAGVITSVATMALWFGGGSRQSSNPIALILLLFLAPFAATLIRLSISRTREYDADEDGARLTGDPLALASALAKLDKGTQARPLAQTGRLENVSHLMIANPFRGAGLARMFSTHPPMENRIARLEEMANQRGFIQ